jgi:Fic family protein
MKEDQLHPVLFACHVHYRLVFIHGFRDGNGRLARLMAAFVLKRARHPYPFVIQDFENTTNIYF